MPTKKDTNNKPYTSNYPVLERWLEKNAQVCQWQIKLPHAAVECWLVNGRPVIIIVYANRMGWDVYTALDTNKIEESLMNAESRVGLTKPDANTDWTAQRKARIIIERTHSETECNTAEDAEELARLVLGIEE